jgi:hypothetical protein
MTIEGNAEEFVIDEQDLTEISDYTPEEIADADKDWQAEAAAQRGIAKRRTTALKKAKEALAKGKAPEPANKGDKGDDNNKPKGLGYEHKAYLASVHDVKHPDDVKFVENAMTSTGRTLEEVMADEFITGKLKEMAEHRATKDATPANGDRSGGAAKDSVEYWLSKGELPPKDQVELRRKVVNAKIAKSRGDAPFAK